MRIIFTAIAAAVLLIACTQNTKEDQLNRKIAEAPVPENETAANNTGTYYTADSAGSPRSPSDQQEKKQPLQTKPAANTDWDKKIIKTASLNVEVKEYSSYSASLREKVKNLGGYVAQEEQNQSEYKIENTLVIKVPADQFDNAVTLLAANTEKINEKKITSQDVSSEFIDTKSRIEAKKQVRQRYMDLLNQAKNMEEILHVQSEINGIQEEIESASGRIQYLGHSAAFSTIALTYYQVLNSLAKEEEKPSFGTKVASAFKTGWSWITDLFVGLVTIWPLLLGGLFIFLLLKRYSKIKPKEN
jgi:Domain of unknown function (DUF4349)